MKYAIVGTTYVQFVSERAGLIRVSASYAMDGGMGSIMFDIPIAEAPNVHVGQALKLSIESVP